MNFKKFAAIAAILCGVACTPEKENEEPNDEPITTEDPSLSAEVKSVETFMINVEISSNLLAEYAVLTISEEEDGATPDADIVFANGRRGELAEGGKTSVSITGLLPETAYSIYVAASDAEGELFEDVIKLSASTAACTDEVTIYNVTKNSATMTVKLPQSVKDAGNVVKWGYLSIALYSDKGGNSNDDVYYLNNSDYWDYLMLKDDGTVVIDEYHSIKRDENGNPCYSEEDPDMVETNFYSPTPGEPGYILMGEFAYDPGDEYGDFCIDNMYNMPGYYNPLYDFDAFFEDKWNSGDDPWGGLLSTKSSVEPMDNQSKYWKGFNHKYRIIFDQPDELDCNIEFKENLRANGGIIHIEPDKNVYGYCVFAITDYNYELIKELYLEGNEEYMQWFTSSLFGYLYGAKYYQETVDFDISGSFETGDNVHLFVAAHGNADATSQKFFHKEYVIPEPSMRIPTIEVTSIKAPEGYTDTPYGAWFNVRCLSHDATKVKYACNYENEFMKVYKSYEEEEDPLASMIAYYGNSFYSDDVEAINSSEGLNVYISSHPGMTLYFGAVAYNLEDIGSPSSMAKAKVSNETAEKVESSLFSSLAGEWTATATVNCKNTDYSSWPYKDIYVDSIMTSKVVLGDISCPSTLDEDAYSHLKEITGYEQDEEVDAYYGEFRKYVREFNERTRSMNRVLAQGFGFFYKIYPDSPDAFAYSSPYELLTSPSYTYYNLEAPILDFGPKWYLEIDAAGNITIPFNFERILPAINFNRNIYYFGAYNKELLAYIPYSLDESNYGETAHFPVEMSADGNTIKIKAYTYDGDLYYPNLIQSSSYGGFYASNPIISEIVLTRGWSGDKEDDDTLAVTTAAATKSVQDGGRSANGILKYQKPRTILVEKKPVKRVTPQPFNKEEVDAKIKKMARKTTAR